MRTTAPALVLLEFDFNARGREKGKVDSRSDEENPKTEEEKERGRKVQTEKKSWEARRVDQQEEGETCEEEEEEEPQQNRLGATNVKSNEDCFDQILTGATPATEPSKAREG